MIYYLALVFFLSLDTEPLLIAGPMTQEECRIEADKQNRNSKVVRDKKVRELGGEFTCFKVERVYL
jgi:hypothetical protein